MSAQPEALRLADELDKTLDFQTRAWSAAHELRRLHNELNEANHLAVYQSQRARDYSGAFMRQMSLNAELLEALEALVDYVDERAGDNECRPLENARAAIAKATGEQS